MIYVYDIVLNWTDEDNLYEFFEWNFNDDLEHIKRIPMFKISSSNLKIMFEYKFKLKPQFIKEIENMTDIYLKNKVESIKYAALFTDGLRTIAVEFDDDGNAIYRSRLLLDEEQDTLILSNKLLECEIEISKLKKISNNEFNTRLEQEMQKVLRVEIEDSYKNKKIDKLKYLYYECFGKDQDDIDLIHNALIKNIENAKMNNCSKLYDVVKLSYQGKI